MRIYLTSAFVSDQQRALDFYTGTPASSRNLIQLVQLTPQT
jgi:hypothetical protein